MRLMAPVVLAASAVAQFLTAAPASPEIVFLSSGRTLSVKDHRIDGDSIVLTLRSGGQVTCAKDLIEKIEADEVPYPEPEAVQPPAPPAPPDPPADRSLLDGTPYAEIIASLSEAHGVNPMLVSALIQVESNF